MAKVSKIKAMGSKKVKKSREGSKKVKKSLEGSEKTKKKPVVYEEEGPPLNEADENITSEEEKEEEEDDDEGHNDERKRQKLLEAINALGGKRKKKLGERSEASVHMSDFTVSAEGEGDKMDLSELIGTVDENPAVATKTKKQLKKLEQSKKTIQSSLSKQESERIQRDVAFQKAAIEVSKWKGVIKQNQRAEQLVFPLNQEPPGPKPMERVVTSWKAHTPLEQEIFALLSANKQPVNDPVLTPVEVASLSAMSLEEAKIRRMELQKARALQSYYEAKARRERKIKSKKYHKVHNKGKRKDFLKQFEEMIKTNPAAAMEELDKVELARMQERMSLKHQNSGKWAKSNAIISKYDKGARKAMQQQLEVNKELTQKLVSSLNNEEEEEEEEEEGSPELLPDFVNDTEGGLDSANPWMRGKLSEPPTERSDTIDLTEEGAGVEGKPTEEDHIEEVEETEEEALLREFDHRRKMRLVQEAETAPVMSVDHDNKAAAEYTSDKEEEEQMSEFSSLFQVIANSRRDAEAVQADAAEDANRTEAAQLEEEQSIRTLEEVETVSQEVSTDEAPAQPQPAPAAKNPTQKTATLKAGKNRKRKKASELKEVLTAKAKVIQVPIAPTLEDTEDTDEKLEQRGLIKEAFAGDDVMSDFLSDKRKQENAARPKVVNLTLPGWGEWGGKGLKPSRHKRRKFRIKTAPPPPRKDQHLPSVIISEKRNSSISLHQVNSLPFPFQNHLQFESTVRSPVGRTWNTEQTVRKITKPKVVTQLGSIIKPMAREQLMKDQKPVSTGNTSSVDMKITLK